MLSKWTFRVGDGAGGAFSVKFPWQVDHAFGAQITLSARCLLPEKCTIHTARCVRPILFNQISTENFVKSSQVVCREV